MPNGVPEQRGAGTQERGLASPRLAARSGRDVQQKGHCTGGPAMDWVVWAVLPNVPNLLPTLAGLRPGQRPAQAAPMHALHSGHVWATH